MDDDVVRRLLDAQAGVISRRQVLENGGNDNDIERLIRRLRWRRVMPGVYVNHTGALTREQRAWAAVLHHWPAALVGQSALDAWGLRRRGGLHAADETVHVGIDARRYVSRTPGIRVHRRGDLNDVTMWNTGPPRIRLEPALLQVASLAADEAAAVAVLADGCQSRRTTAARLLDALQKLPRLPRRKLLHAILLDVAVGAFSVMERRYLCDVERRHGLPTAKRQRLVRQGKTVAHRDVDHLAQRVVVELDGRLGHEWAADRWADLDRDIDSALDDQMTLRVGWKQVLDPCRLAAAVARLLRARGWRGQPQACSLTCPVRWLCAESPAPDAGDSAQSG